MQRNLCSLENESTVTFLSDIHCVILEAKSMRQPTKPHLTANGFYLFLCVCICAEIHVYMLCMGVYARRSQRLMSGFLQSSSISHSKSPKPKLAQFSLSGLVIKLFAPFSLPPGTGFTGMHLASLGGCWGSISSPQACKASTSPTAYPLAHYFA